MGDLKQACAKATDNVTRQIYHDRQFPRNVFGAQWYQFFFFDSDWMFEAEFVGYVKSFLESEGATCACLTNIDAAKHGERLESRFLIDRTTSPEEYQSLLKGAGPGTGWIYDIDRYGCASDVCEWYIYCERRSEIGVIAIRRDVSPERYIPVIAQFKAVSLREAIEKPLTYGFSPRALSEGWRRELLAEYTSRD